MTKILLTLIALIVILVGGFFVLNNYIYEQKQGSGEITEPYRATLSGVYVCLPHLDQTGPQTDECANGIKTDVGEYYAVDFNLMSDSPAELTMGQRFTGSGVITPVERLSTDMWQKYPIKGIFSITDSVAVEATTSQPFACDGDAMICPDGSSVGRSGPNCEFVACPSPTATSAVITTYLGGTATALSVSVSPQEIISDSRCPAGATCVWAGTVEVRAVLSTPVSHGELVLKLGESQVFGDYTVTLQSVSPEKQQDTISDSSYRFTFAIAKRTI